MTETNINNLERLLSPLGQKELTALEMKFEGYNYKEIAEAIEEKYHTVRTWFMTGGKLHDFYVAYAKTEGESRKKEAHDTFKAHLNNAVRTLVALMNKSKFDLARLGAAKEIINRQLGEPLKIIVSDDGRVNEILEAIRKDDEETLQRVDGSGESKGIQEGTQ